MTLRKLYELVGKVEDLPEMAGLVARELGAHAARVGLIPDLARPDRLFVDYNLDPATVSEYVKCWAPRDLWFQGYLQLRAAKGGPVVATHHEMVDRKALQQSDYFNEFLAPQGFESVAVVDLDVFGAGTPDGCSVAFLSETGKELSRRDIAESWPLLFHLQRAVRLTFDMERARLRHAELVDGLEALGIALALLAENERLLYASPSFLAAIRGTLTIRNDRLNSDQLDVCAAMAEAIRKAAHPQGIGSVVPVRKKQSQTRLLLKFHPLPDRAPMLGVDETARVLIQLHVPGEVRQPEWEVIADQFRLTRAELRLCKALYGGVTVSDYCEEVGITQATARTQLQHVFVKTDTKRQSELVTLLASFVIA